MGGKKENLVEKFIISFNLSASVTIQTGCSSKSFPFSLVHMSFALPINVKSLNERDFETFQNIERPVTYFSAKWHKTRKRIYSIMLSMKKIYLSERNKNWSMSTSVTMWHNKVNFNMDQMIPLSIKQCYSYTISTEPLFLPKTMRLFFVNVRVFHFLIPHNPKEFSRIKWWIHC